MIPSNLNCCRFEILENNKQTRESTALSVAYNVESWRRRWEGIVGRCRRVASWTYPDTLLFPQVRELQSPPLKVGELTESPLSRLGSSL
jgi:hypothetical protein